VFLVYNHAWLMVVHASWRVHNSASISCKNGCLSFLNSLGFFQNSYLLLSNTDLFCSFNHFLFLFRNHLNCSCCKRPIIHFLLAFQTNRFLLLVLRNRFFVSERRDVSWSVWLRLDNAGGVSEGVEKLGVHSVFACFSICNFLREIGLENVDTVLLNKS